MYASEIPAGHVTARAGMLVTTAARTVVDLARIVHFDWREITQTPQKVAAAIRVAFRRGSLAQVSG